MGIDIAAERKRKLQTAKKSSKPPKKQRASSKAKRCYVADNLLKNERIIHWGKVHWFVFIPGLLLIGCGMMIPAFIAKIPVAEHDYLPEAALIAAPIFVICTLAGLIGLTKAIFYKISTELAITDKRVIAKIGFIRRNTIELSHNKVESLAIHQSIVGRLLDFGTIIVNGTGGGRTPINGITAPLSFRRIAMTTIDKAQNSV